jgi:hypothetical protein
MNTKKALGSLSAAFRSLKRQYDALFKDKAELHSKYNELAKEDPQERGHVGFARGLGDEYFRQITSEVRVLKRAPSGAMVARWELVDTVRRNECLDAMNYAEAAARRKGWAAMTEDQWGALELASNPYANFAAGITGIRAFYTCDVGVRTAGAFSAASSIT